MLPLSRAGREQRACMKQGSQGPELYNAAGRIKEFNVVRQQEPVVARMLDVVTEEGVSVLRECG